MTAKERVKTVFAHKIPDKVPVFEQLVDSRVATQILGRQADPRRIGRREAPTPSPGIYPEL